MAQRLRHYRYHALLTITIKSVPERSLFHSEFLGGQRYGLIEM
jgi:hypothetical protein